MSEKLLVCGGAGFIGSSLALGLKVSHPDWQVICLDNLRRRGSELNLIRLKEAGIEFLHGDIRCSADLDPEVLTVNTILDCSAEPSVLAGFSSPDYVLQTNLMGTVNILELARKVNARLLFLSTSRVYPIEPLKSITLQETATRYAIASQQSLPGISEKGVSEQFPLAGYRSLYGTTKLTSELLIEEYRHAYGLKAVVNRCGVVTGPWQMGKVDQGVFVLWMAAHYFKRPLSYIGYGGSGKQVRDLLHISDLLSLIDYQLQHFSNVNGMVTNVGGGFTNSLSLLETTDLCEEITGNQIPINSLAEDRPGDLPLFITDIAKVTDSTGWLPQLTPKKTLQDIFDWLHKNERQLTSILS